MSDKCQCTMRIKMVGDGCKYCNPQHYIDILEDQQDDNEQKIQSLEAELANQSKAYGLAITENAELRDTVERYRKMLNKLGE